jgi:hypothetical protein
MNGCAPETVSGTGAAALAGERGTPAAVLSWQGTLARGLTLVNSHNGTLRLTGTPAKGSQGACTLFIAALNGNGPAALQRFTSQVV